MRALTAKTLATWVSSSDRISSGIVRASTVQWSMASKRTPALRHSSTVRWAQPGIVARAATASGAWAGWAAPVSRSSLSSTVPKCFTARRFAQPGSESSVVRSSSTGWRIKSVYFRVRRLYSRCNSFLVRSVYCIPFPLLFYLHRLLYTWEWCMYKVFSVCLIYKIYMTDCFSNFFGYAANDSSPLPCSHSCASASRSCRRRAAWR